MLFTTETAPALSRVSRPRLLELLTAILHVQRGGADAYTFENVTSADHEAIYTLCGMLGVYYRSYNATLPPGRAHVVLRRAHIARSVPVGATTTVLLHLIHTPKCAGMALKAYIRAHDLSPYAHQAPPKHFPRHFRLRSRFGIDYVVVNGHVPARNMHLPGSVCVGLARDPFARVASAFRYVQHGTVDRDDLNDRFPRWRKRLQAYPSLGNLLGDTATMDQLMAPRTGLRHFYPMSYYIADHRNRLLLDFCLCQDTLDADWQTLCDVLGLAHEPLRKYNVTKTVVPAGDTDAAATTTSAAAPTSTAAERMHQQFTRRYHDDVALWSTVRARREEMTQTLRATVQRLCRRAAKGGWGGGA